MKPAMYVMMEQAQAAAKQARFIAKAKRRAKMLLILGVCAVLAYLATGCASDLDDAEVMANDATAAAVWYGTWGYTIGAPPPITYDEGNDPKCTNPDAFWVDHTAGCAFGAFNPEEFSIRLSRRKGGDFLGHELAHAAYERFGEREGPIFWDWSDHHSPEFWRQVCRAEVRHEAITGTQIESAACTRAQKAAIAATEDVR